MTPRVVDGLLELGRRVARDYPVEFVPGWEQRGQGPMTTVAGLVHHHTAGGRSGPAPSLRVVTHGRPGLRGLLSQLYRSREWRGRPPTLYVCGAGKAWHAGDSAWLARTFLNSTYLGIEEENDGTAEPFTARELELAHLVAYEASDIFAFTAAAVAEHKEVARPRGRKIDRRGIDGPAWRDRITLSPFELDVDDDDDQEDLDVIHAHSPAQYVRHWQRLINRAIPVLYPQRAISVQNVQGTWVYASEIPTSGIADRTTLTAWHKILDAIAVGRHDHLELGDIVVLASYGVPVQTTRTAAA